MVRLEGFLLRSFSLTRSFHALLCLQRHIDNVGQRRIAVEHMDVETFVLEFPHEFQAFFLVFALALLANLPSSVSDSMGISRLPLVVAMALMVGISLINYVVALLPTGLETQPREKSKEGIVALFYAIEKGNLVYAQKVLSMNFDPNMVAENGYTPLMYAAARGDAKMVDLLVRNGADVNMISRDGDTALELALRTGSAEVADIIKKARAEQLAREEAARAKEAKK